METVLRTRIPGILVANHQAMTIQALVRSQRGPSTIAIADHKVRGQNLQDHQDQIAHLKAVHPGAVHLVEAMTMTIVQVAAAVHLAEVMIVAVRAEAVHPAPVVAAHHPAEVLRAEGRLVVEVEANNKKL
jgi:DNA-directed RNA polymerase beta subunit